MIKSNAIRRSDLPQIVIDEFWRSFLPVPSGCWEWNRGVLTDKGYGKMFGHAAHRLSFSIYKSDVPEGMLVLHECDNPKCVNPKHLKLGTAKDNALDRAERRRKPAKITWEQADEIRNSSEKTAYWMKKYGVGYSAIYAIRGGRSHVGRPPKP